jgi:membrane dipeptidase
MLKILPALIAGALLMPTQVPDTNKNSPILIDTHDDTTQRLLDPNFNLAQRHTDGNLDIPRMRQGAVDALFFSIWIPSKVTGPTAVKRAIDQIDAVRSTIQKNPNDLTLATTAAEIRAAKQQNKIAALMGVEGGHMIDSDLSVLRTFAAQGVRYMTLTHMGNTEWADSSTDKPAHNGLTDFGKKVIREMNRLGMMVDVSHVSDKTFADVLATSEAPVIASHSSCRALCSAARNMTDEMIRQLAAKGGVIQINFHVAFLSQQLRDFENAHPEIDKQIDAETKERCGPDHSESCATIVKEQITWAYMRSGKLPKVDWTQIIDHIDHAVKIAGIDHVGIGSDFDGAIMPLGMEDASHLPQIAAALKQRGYSPTDISKIQGENTLHLMTQVESTADKLNAK